MDSWRLSSLTRWMRASNPPDVLSMGRRSCDRLLFSSLCRVRPVEDKKRRIRHSATCPRSVPSFHALAEACWEDTANNCTFAVGCGGVEGGGADSTDSLWAREVVGNHCGAAYFVRLPQRSVICIVDVLYDFFFLVLPALPCFFFAPSIILQGVPPVLTAGCEYAAFVRV
ncbi:hypothetical protein MOQ_001497, partial [Trypanosoma cruzi marinkellei]